MLKYIKALYDAMQQAPFGKYQMGKSHREKQKKWHKKQKKIN